MAVIRVKRRHKLGAREARATVDKIAQKLRKELDADCRWVGSSLQFKRSGASGHIDVNEDDLEINIKLGMVLSPLKRKIEKSIEEEIDQHLTA
jgi:putative polyhydroxyalkanoate system protein